MCCVGNTFSLVKLFRYFHLLLYVAVVIYVWFLCSVGDLYMLIYMFYMLQSRADMSLTIRESGSRESVCD